MKLNDLVIFKFFLLVKLSSGEARLLLLAKLNVLVIFLRFSSCEAKPLTSGEARIVPLAKLFS